MHDGYYFMTRVLEKYLRTKILVGELWGHVNCSSLSCGISSRQKYYYREAEGRINSIHGQAIL